MSRGRPVFDFPLPSPDQLLSWGQRRHDFFSTVERLPTRELKLQYLSRAYTAETLRRIKQYRARPVQDILPSSTPPKSAEETELSQASRSVSPARLGPQEDSLWILKEPYAPLSMTLACKPLLDLIAADLDQPERTWKAQLDPAGEPGDLVALLACIELIVQQSRTQKFFRVVFLKECRAWRQADSFFASSAASLDRAAFQASLKPSTETIRLLADSLHNSIGVVTEPDFIHDLMKPERLGAVYAENREKIVSHYVRTVRSV
jgi:hypothetical protein